MSEEIEYKPGEKVIYSIKFTSKAQPSVREYLVTVKWRSQTNKWYWIELPNGHLKSVKESSLRRK